MDNEKRPEYLEKILKKEGYKAANEDPALDQKKVIAPLKDESTILPEEKRDSRHIDTIREKGKSAGRGIGGGGNATTNQTENEHKTPTQKMLEKGSQRTGGGRGGRGGTPMIKELDEILKEKNDVINPEDILSKKQESQQQQAQYKPVINAGEIPQKMSVRERVYRAKEAKEQQVQKVEREVEVGKEGKQIGIRDRIARAVSEQKDAQRETPKVKEKTVEVAMNKAKQPPPKSIKR